MSARPSPPAAAAGPPRGLPVRGGYLPNREQELLLQVVFLPAGEALRAWETWRSRLTLDDIDGGSCRLLPIVYRTLQGHGWNGPEMGRIKGLYRQTWYRNQLLKGRLAGVVRALASRGIDALVLKGVAFAELYYRDPGLRPMDDADLMVPVDRAPDALRLLAESSATVRP